MLYDVVGVNLKTKLVRFMAQGEDETNAEAVVKIAVIRRGVEEEFFVEVPEGSYEEGEKWEGQREV